MIKGIAGFTFIVFLGLSWFQCGLSPGISFFMMVLLTTLMGVIALFGLGVTQGFMDEVWGPLNSGATQGSVKLAQQIESIATLIRQDGLLALEAKRKEIRDPFFRHLLKKVMDGFESKDLVPLIQNRAEKRMDLANLASDGLGRLTGLVPTVGLIQSLFLLAEILSPGNRPADLVGVSSVFLPFLVALVIQLIFETGFGRLISQRREEDQVYFVVLEEGLTGIQQGVNPDLLSDRIRARIEVNPRWKDS